MISSLSQNRIYCQTVNRTYSNRRCDSCMVVPRSTSTPSQCYFLFSFFLFLCFKIELPRSVPYVSVRTLSLSLHASCHVISYYVSIYSQHWIINNKTDHRQSRSVSTRSRFFFFFFFFVYCCSLHFFYLLSHRSSSLIEPRTDIHTFHIHVFLNRIHIPSSNWNSI